MHKSKSQKEGFQSPGFSFGYRFDEDAERAAKYPGPGSYNPPSFKKSDGIKFPRSHRFDRFAARGEAPGPGAYYLDASFASISQSLISSKDTSSFLSKQVPTFPRAQRSGIFNSSQIQVGPGYYIIKREFEDAASSKKSSRSRSKDEDKTRSDEKTLKKIEPTPGPGQYDADKSITSKHTRSPGFKVGTSQREFLNIKQMAEQGLQGDIFRYNKCEYMKGEGPKASISTGKRTELSPKNNLPGPADYFTEAKEPKDNKRSTKGTFGLSNRIDNLLKEKEFAPGPGEYEIITDQYQKGIKMARSSRVYNDELRSTPGPGYYNIPNEFEEKRKELEKKAALAKSLMKAHVIGDESKRSNDNIMIIDGLTQSTAVTFPKVSSSRDNSPKRQMPMKTMWIDEEVKKSVSPGPAYIVQMENIETKLGNSGTKFPSLARPEFAISEIKKSVPGPGSYNSAVKKHTAHISFAKTKRKENPVLQESTLEVPSPDKYQHLNIKKPVMGGSFGRAERRIGMGEKSASVSPIKRRPKQKKQEKTEVEETESKMDTDMNSFVDSKIGSRDDFSEISQ